jgi:hypothetical protein
MLASRTCRRASRLGNLLRRGRRFAANVLRALLIGTAAFGPPRPPPEPPPAQTTEQVSDTASRT